MLMARGVDQRHTGPPTPFHSSYPPPDPGGLTTRGALCTLLAQRESRPDVTLAPSPPHAVGGEPTSRAARSSAGTSAARFFVSGTLRLRAGVRRTRTGNTHSDDPTPPSRHQPNPGPAVGSAGPLRPSRRGRGVPVVHDRAGWPGARRRAEGKRAIRSGSRILQRGKSRGRRVERHQPELHRGATSLAPPAQPPGGAICVREPDNQEVHDVE